MAGLIQAYPSSENISWWRGWEEGVTAGHRGGLSILVKENPHPNTLTTNLAEFYFIFLRFQALLVAHPYKKRISNSLAHWVALMILSCLLFAQVTCYALNNKCQLKVKSNTCYCCDLYNCENSEHSTSYYEFLGVSSCHDVIHLYRLLWSSTVLNIIGLFLGIITAAILGAFKDVVPASQIAFSSAPPPQILYNPAQQILTYAGFCPSAASVPHYPSYHLPLQPTGNFPTSSSTDVSLADDPQPPSQASCNHGVPPNAPPLYTPAYFLSGEKPPPYIP